MNKLTIVVFVSLMLFAYSCGNNNSAIKEYNHSEGDGHNHTTEMVNEQKINLKDIRNEKGELTDEAGNIIVGCPMHKEIIGSEGDMCPKCNYMEMVPITWSMEGVEAVRVTSLPDYNPPKN